jgi:membrane protease YdiL (CAAX protease family)
MGWWKVVGFRSPGKPSDLLYFIIPFLPILINLIPGVQVTSLFLLTETLVFTLLIGFSEEVIFRGLMLNALKARGFWRAAIITSLLFGFLHSMNALNGESVADLAMQLCYATAMGFAFAALVLKKGILWPLVIAHFLTDFADFNKRPGFTFPPGWDWLITVSISVIFTAYGVFVMLQRDKE